jgi:hypothetical protein
MTHRCHAEGCDQQIPPRLFMCADDWRLVPPALQRAIWRAYVPGQEVRKDPTTEYVVVAREAIAAVAARKRRGRDDVKDLLG